jgi:hypothetical protein
MHINECIDNLIIKNKNINYLLKINDENNFYWLYIMVGADLKLCELDKFLKKTWLECCGHLSKFIINDDEYENDNMNHKIKNIVNDDLVFKYEYDFGSTTELKIRVIKKFNSMGGKIKIISRNSIPKYKCNICNKYNSTKICFECQDTFCEKCVYNKRHKCRSNKPDESNESDEFNGSDRSNELDESNGSNESNESNESDKYIFDLINSPRMTDCFYMSNEFNSC